MALLSSNLLCAYLTAAFLSIFHAMRLTASLESYSSTAAPGIRRGLSSDRIFTDPAQDLISAFIGRKHPDRCECFPPGLSSDFTGLPVHLQDRFVIVEPLCESLVVPLEVGRQPHLSLLFAALLSGIIVLFLQMDRNPILKSLEPPTSGFAEGFGILSKMLSIGGLPLLAVVASQFPSVATFLVSWIKPVMEAAH